MKKFLVCFLLLCLAVSFAGCSSDGGKITNDNAGNSASDNVPDDLLSEGGNATVTDERITFITQLYDGDNIVEIPYIEYEGSNPELDSINRLFNQGYQFQYEEFLNNKAEHEWIEIKSYPFTTQDYLQIVTTKIIYPNYGTDGDLESVNYDRLSEQWLTVDDALLISGMSRDDVLAGIGADFVPEAAGELISNVEISGFLIREDVAGKHVVFLLTLTLENSEGSQYEAFYSYYPDRNDNTNDLTSMNNDCLFDPYDMDEMDPPLWYQQNAVSL